MPSQGIRYGRYILVSTEPTAGQRDLLSQIIDVRIPPALKPMVQDAMRPVRPRMKKASATRRCTRARKARLQQKLNGRVDDGVTTVAPHRSGRARLTHPAPQIITYAGNCLPAAPLLAPSKF